MISARNPKGASPRLDFAQTAFDTAATVRCLMTIARSAIICASYELIFCGIKQGCALAVGFSLPNRPWGAMIDEHGLALPEHCHSLADLYWCQLHRSGGQRLHVGRRFETIKKCPKGKKRPRRQAMRQRRRLEYSTAKVPGRRDRIWQTVPRNDVGLLKLCTK
jgi:hypothetical protein